MLRLFRRGLLLDVSSAFGLWPPTCGLWPSAFGGLWPLAPFRGRPWMVENRWPSMNGWPLLPTHPWPASNAQPIMIQSEWPSMVNMEEVSSFLHAFLRGGGVFMLRLRLFFSTWLLNLVVFWVRSTHRNDCFGSCDKVVGCVFGDRALVGQNGPGRMIICL